MIHTVAFTGYRPQKMPYSLQSAAAEDLNSRLASTLDCLLQAGYTHFISGAALGFDTLAADAVLDLRRTNAITLELAIPYAAQSEKWSEADQAHWRNLCEKADRITLLAESYDKGCMFRRNRYMVEHSALLLACYDGQPGGTKMTIDVAKQLHRQVLVIPPIPLRKAV